MSFFSSLEAFQVPGDLPCAALKPPTPVPAVGTGPGSLPPRFTQERLGKNHCLGEQLVCLPLLEGAGSVFSSCNCYHLFRCIVFVDVFLF